MWILISVLPLSKFDISDSTHLDSQNYQSQGSKYRQNTSSQKFLNRQNFLSSPNILSRFCQFLGPPEYSDKLEFSPPEYSDDLEFSDIFACWFWTKTFVIKKLLFISCSRRRIGVMQSKKILQKSKRTFKSLFCFIVRLSKSSFRV